jgi:hypothetical protein
MQRRFALVLAGRSVTGVLEQEPRLPSVTSYVVRTQDRSPCRHVTRPSSGVCRRIGNNSVGSRGSKRTSLFKSWRALESWRAIHTPHGPTVNFSTTPDGGSAARPAICPGSSGIGRESHLSLTEAGAMPREVDSRQSEAHRVETGTNPPACCPSGCPLVDRIWVMSATAPIT